MQLIATTDDHKGRTVTVAGYFTDVTDTRALWENANAHRDAEQERKGSWEKCITIYSSRVGVRHFNGRHVRITGKATVMGKDDMRSLWTCNPVALEDATITLEQIQCLQWVEKLTLREAGKICQSHGEMSPDLDAQPLGGPRCWFRNWCKLNDVIMLRKSMKLFREISTMIPRFRSLEEQCADTQIELRQLMTLLSLTTEIRAIPPKHLQIRVAGVYKARFFESGRNLINDMEDFLQENGESLFKANDILDFGCGCGRMLIPLSFMISPSKIVGTDIDKQSIGWLKSNYAPFKALDVNKIKPPTKYANATFDLVYGVSVFTHLPEDMQHAWLREMSRIMKPGGLGLFTTHGEKFYSKLAGSALREFTDRGFYYSVGKVTEGLPEFYQTSFQSHDYIYREWTKHFDVVAIRREGAKQQDAVLVRNRSKS